MEEHTSVSLAGTTSATQNKSNDYYVYVYIDPRNFEEFYYGKGRGPRKDAHLTDTSDCEKARRIKEIRDAKREPIIRVIAQGLSEDEALLVEKTLLWKLGRQLTNIASGHYAKNFRPHNTMHVEIKGFDYQCGFYYYNVGECDERNWNDYKKFGFISAGQGLRWRDAMLSFREGDIVAAYLKGHGFVGIGKLTSEAKPIRDVVVNGNPLLKCDLQCKGMARNFESDELCEYVATVEWLNAVDRSEAKKQSGIFTTPLVRASLDNQPDTVKFLEEAFGIKISQYLNS